MSDNLEPVKVRITKSDVFTELLKIELKSRGDERKFIAEYVPEDSWVGAITTGDWDAFSKPNRKVK